MLSAHEIAIKSMNVVSMYSRGYSFTKLFYSVMIAKYYEDMHASKIAGFPQLSLQMLFMDSPSLVVVRNFFEEASVRLRSVYPAACRVFFDVPSINDD